MSGSYLLYNELHYNGLMTDWGLSCRLSFRQAIQRRETNGLWSEHLALIVSSLTIGKKYKHFLSKTTCHFS